MISTPEGPAEKEAGNSSSRSQGVCGRSGRRGFTLVEVLLATAVLGATLLTLVSVCGLGLRANKKSLYALTAAQVAERQLDRWISRAVVNDEPSGARRQFWTDEGLWKQGEETIGGVKYEYRISIRTVPGAGDAVPNNRLKKVDIEVSWLEGEREGLGRLKEFGYRLVNEEDTL